MYVWDYFHRSFTLFRDRCELFGKFLIRKKFKKIIYRSSTACITFNISKFVSDHFSRLLRCCEHWATSWENQFMQHANNKGADQPAHPRSLISTFVVRCLDSIIPLVSISEISSLCLASVAAQAGWVYPGRKPRRQVFSWRGSYMSHGMTKPTKWVCA